MNEAHREQSIRCPASRVQRGADLAVGEWPDVPGDRVSPEVAIRVDVASGAIARYAPLAETGLYGAYAVGDILEAPAPVATATTPTRITLHLRTHSLSRNQWTPLVTSVAGASPGGKVTLTFIDASQHPHSTVSVSVPLIGNVAAYNLPPCASQFDNVRLKEIVCSGHFKVRAKYSGDARNGRSISEKFVLKRAAS